jgi:hypothetical protein
MKATTLLLRIRRSMYPDEEDFPETLEGLVAAYGNEEDPMLEYSRAQSTSGAEAAITLALASGIKGDFKGAFSTHPKGADGREVDLAPFGAKASRYAQILSETMERMVQEAEARQKAAKAKGASSSSAPSK